MPIVRLKMSSKLISSLMVIFFIATPYVSSAHDIPKPSFSLGTMLISDNAFNALAGAGVTINDSDIVANFIVDYHVSPSLAFEGGVITSPEISASLPSNDSGTLHGKSYSASGALTLKAITDTSYLEHMIPHHQVAIDMSKRLLLHTNHSYLMDFCRKLIIDQQGEIFTMNNLLKNKYNLLLHF